MKQDKLINMSPAASVRDDDLFHIFFEKPRARQLVAVTPSGFGGLASFGFSDAPVLGGRAADV